MYLLSLAQEHREREQLRTIAEPEARLFCHGQDLSDVTEGKSHVDGGGITHLHHSLLYDPHLFYTEMYSHTFV